MIHNQNIILAEIRCEEDENNFKKEKYVNASVNSVPDFEILLNETKFEWKDERHIELFSELE